MIGVKKLIAAASVALAAVTFSIAAQPAEARDRHHHGYRGQRGFPGQRYDSNPRGCRSYPRYDCSPRNYYRPSPYYYSYPYNPTPYYACPSPGGGFGFGFQYWDD